MKFSRIVSLLCIFSLCINIFAGCSNKDVETSGVDDQQKNEGNEKIELRMSWWGGPERHEATLAVLDAYMEKNPNVVISAEYSGWDGYYQKLVTQLASGTAPDIIQIDYKWLYDLRAQDKFFTDPRELKDMIDLSGFTEASLAACSVDNEVQGLPTGLNATTLIYNKEFFEKNNISEDMVWNWDNLIEIGKQVHEADPKQYLLNEFPNSVAILMSMYLEQQGKEIVKEDFTIGVTQEDLVEAFTLVQKLFDNNVILPFSESALYVDKTEQFPKWLNGEIGMYIQVASVIPSLEQNFEVGVMPVPMIEGATLSGINVFPTNMFAVNDKGEHKEEVAKFLNYVMNDEEAVKILGDVRGIPSTAKNRTTLEDNNLISPKISKAISIAENNPGLPTHRGGLNQELNKIIKDYVEMFGFGELTAEEAAKQMLEDLNAKSEELKSK